MLLVAQMESAWFASNIYEKGYFYKGGYLQILENPDSSMYI